MNNSTEAFDYRRLQSSHKLVDIEDQLFNEYKWKLGKDLEGGKIIGVYPHGVAIKKIVHKPNAPKVVYNTFYSFVDLFLHLEGEYSCTYR